MFVSHFRFRLLWLTLLAFGVQICVADFHHHVARGTGIQARALTAGMCAPSQGRPCAPLEKDHDGCVLCWATAIAATSLTPALFSVPTPSMVTGVRLKAVEPPQFRVARRAESRARGPPRIDLG
ncbi:hypothetical protein [Hyphomicrobium sp.]|jgi:hypothetical protein|uniref:hypothetical protein n=1 Tax=Hyphomicrobium sp. TaxID=82 RepID=UPI003561ADFA